MTDPAFNTAPPSTDLVAAECPPARTDTPRPVRSPHGLIALPLMVPFWFLPKRTGVRVAASGWRAAVAAHLFALTFGLGLVLWAEDFADYNPFQRAQQGVAIRRKTGTQTMMSGTEYLRAPLAAWVLTLHDAAGSLRSRSYAHPGIVLLVLEPALLLCALALMPFAAAGEPFGRLFGRCLRLVLWSTVIAVPLGIAILTAPAVNESLGLDNRWHQVDFIALSLVALWWIVVLLRSGLRYAGPPDGPGWEARLPQCEGCGYAIAQIPRSTNCPECGKPVADSLPERRQPPLFATAVGRWSKMRSFGITLWAALFDKTFFQRLSVHQHSAAARSYFLWLGALIALFVMTPLVDSRPSATSRTGSVELLGFVLASTILMFIAEFILCGLLIVFDAVVRRRPVQVAANIVFYGLSALLPVAMALAFFVSAESRLRIKLPGIGMDNPRTGMSIAISAVLFVIGAACCLVAWCSFRRAIRDTKAANA